jgi:hypothetical protein
MKKEWPAFLLENFSLSLASEFFVVFFASERTSQKKFFINLQSSTHLFVNIQTHTKESQQSWREVKKKTSRKLFIF